MKKAKHILAVFLTLSMFISMSFALHSFEDTQNDNSGLNEHLKPLKPFTGKTWRGKSPNADPDKPFEDISRWERALNGQAVRILHSINEGAYGGETLIVWDRKKESLVFYYFTTEGFYTSGTIKMEDGKMISHEIVTGNENGITEVQSVGTILPDGRLHSKSQYLKNGEWVDGHEFIYEEAPAAKVIFK